MMRYGLILLFLLSSPVMAQLYKWTDENGKVQYSDQPPLDGRDSQKVQTQTKNTSSSDNPAAKSLAEKSLEFRKRRAAAEEAEAKETKEAAQAKQKKENCEQARGRLSALESGVRITKYDAAGERVFLTDEDRTREIPQVQKEIDHWCK